MIIDSHAYCFQPGNHPAGFPTAAEHLAALRSEMTELLHGVQASYPRPAGEFWLPQRLGGAAPTPAEAKRLDEAELAQRSRRRTDRA